MTHRERVLKTFHFEQIDRLAYDLTEGRAWDSLIKYFDRKYSINSELEILDFLDTDFRWVWMDKNEAEQKNPPGAHPKTIAHGPLSNAVSIGEVEAYDWINPSDYAVGDLSEERRKWPNHALVFVPGWFPIFWTACEVFGVEAALVKMKTEPRIFQAFLEKHQELCMDILKRGVSAAKEHCDIFWYGDDFASQTSLLISPADWRKFIKPYLAEQVNVAKSENMLVMYHSCGAIRPILPDLVEVGIDGLTVVQTTAAGMDSQSLAKEWGGKLVFYGAMDVQHLLSFGSVHEVQKAVLENAQAFADSGGYIVANSHTIDSIKGENIEMMCKTAREIVF